MVAAGFALGPQPRLRAAVEGDTAALERRAERVLVHVAEHQQLQRRGVLDDGGNDPVHLRPVQRADVVERQGRISIPHERRYSLRSGMAISRSWKTVAASAPLAPIAKASRKWPGS